jgi:hypothetical protein
MKRKTMATLALLLAVGIGTALAGNPAAASKTVEGTLVDTACYFKDSSLKGNDHGSMPKCGTACAKGGNPVGILTSQGKHFPLVVASPLVADYVGETVRATGAVQEGSLVPAKLEVKKGDKWEAIKLPGMM